MQKSARFLTVGFRCEGNGGLNMASSLIHLSREHNGFRLDFVDLDLAIQHFSLFHNVDGLSIGKKGLTFSPFC